MMSATEERTVLIETLTNQGRHFEARNLAEEELRKGDNLRVQQLYALALSKSGAPQAARDFLEPIHLKNTADAETAGILGSIYKAMFRKEQNTSFALKSRDTYLKNFTITKDYYTGINAATMSAIAGQAARGREIAKEIIASLSDVPETFWTSATLGEACLLNK